jgi:hypothetical protein
MISFVSSGFSDFPSWEIIPAVQRCTAGNRAIAYAESLKIMKTTDYADTTDIGSEGCQGNCRWLTGVILLGKQIARITAAFPRTVFGKRDQRAKGPKSDRALRVPV